MGKSQSMNNLVLNGADSIRQNIFQMNKKLKAGQITPAEYKSFMNTTSDNWANLAASGQSYDKRFTEILERQQPDGDGSMLEGYRNELAASTLELNNSEIYQNPETGIVYMVKRDKDGNIINQQDVRRMNNPSNIVNNKVKLNDVVSAEMKKIPKFQEYTELKRGGSSTVTDIRTNPEFQNFVATTQNAMTKDHSQAASILTDNGANLPVYGEDGKVESYRQGNWMYYSSESEKDKLIQEALQVQREAAEMGDNPLTPEEEADFIEMQEKMMIQTAEDDNGILQPVLTDEQIKAAKEQVRVSIEINAGHEESGQASRSWRSEYGAPTGGGDDDDDTGGGYDLYDKSRLAWMSSKKDQAKSAAELTALAGGRYEFAWGQGGLEIHDVMIDPKNRKANLIAKVDNLEDLSPYLYGSTGAAGADEALVEFRRQRGLWNKDNKKTKPKTKPKPGSMG